MKYSIGLDGTDSVSGGCTTWTASRIIDTLHESDDQLSFLTFPRLVRLNPNIPIKTRGNGAIAINIETELGLEELLELVRAIVDKDVKRYRKGLDFKASVVISPYPYAEHEKYWQALQYNIEQREEWVELPNIRIWPKDTPSVIGAGSAINAELFDYTFELLAYRKDINFGKKRVIDSELLSRSAKEYQSTFSSFDEYQNRELICPSGADPVFCGIRGDNPRDLVYFLDSLDIKEDLWSYTIFQTNQGTNAHVVRPKQSLEPYSVLSSVVTLVSDPAEISGGHVITKIMVGAEIIDLLIFEPTKSLRDHARQLITGDKIYLHGAVIKDEHGLSVHGEYFSVVDLAKNQHLGSPLCRCGSRMTKAGRFSGYKCRDCGDRSYDPEIETKERELFNGERVFASPSAQRHLTRPRSRFLSINNQTPIDADYHHFRKLIS